MKLSGSDYKKLVKSLSQAYPTKSDLAMMVRFYLDEDLNVITGGQTTKEIIFNLIKWGEAHEKMQELLNAVSLDRSNAVILQEIVRELLEKYFLAQQFQLEKDVQNQLYCVVTGGLKASSLALKLAEAIGYNVVKRRHILLNGGAEGIDKAAIEGANRYQQEATIFESKIIAYRPKTLAQTYNHLVTEVQIIGETKAERRDAIARNADCVILLGGSKGTMDCYHRALNYKKPIIPVGCSGGAAFDIWHELKSDHGKSYPYNTYLSNTDIDSLNPSPDAVIVEALASVVVKLAEKLCMQFKSTLGYSINQGD